MKELLKDHPLDLFILIPSLPETSSLKKLDLASRYSSWFHDLNLRLQFFTDCTLDEQKAIAAFFDDSVSFSSLSEEEAAILYECLQVKPVFGKERCYIFPSLILKDGDEILHQTRRINASAIENLLEAALKAQYRYLKSRLANQIDIISAL